MEDIISKLTFPSGRPDNWTYSKNKGQGKRNLWSINSIKGWSIQYGEGWNRADRDDKYFLSVYKDGTFIKSFCFWDFPPKIEDYNKIIWFIDSI